MLVNSLPSYNTIKHLIPSIRENLRFLPKEETGNPVYILGTRFSSHKKNTFKYIMNEINDFPVLLKMILTRKKSKFPTHAE